MDDNDLPSKDIEKLIELWQQEECLWIISLEGHHKNDSKGNQLTGSERNRQKFHSVSGFTCNITWALPRTIILLLMIMEIKKMKI